MSHRTPLPAVTYVNCCVPAMLTKGILGSSKTLTLAQASHLVPGGVRVHRVMPLPYLPHCAAGPVAALLAEGAAAGLGWWHPGWGAHLALCGHQQHPCFPALLLPGGISHSRLQEEPMELRPCELCWHPDSAAGWLEEGASPGG